MLISAGYDVRWGDAARPSLPRNPALLPYRFNHMRSRIWVLALVLVVAACGDGTSETTTTGSPGTTTSPTVVPPTTNAPATTQPAVTTTTAAPGVDFADLPWVLHTIEGITDPSGTVLFDTDPLLGGENLVRDRDGGIFFTDTFGLWWWPAGEEDPDLVLDGSFFRLIEAIPTASGPVVRIADVADRYFDVTNLSEVAPLEGAVETTDDFGLIQHATNGLSATVTQPEVTLSFEGFPDDVIEPAHLLISRDGETLLDLRIGGPVEAFARLHDFDGRRVIVSRGPYEPALPPETFFVIDLACPECTKTFIEAAATATLTGPDAEWDGIVAGPSGICSSWDPSFTQAPEAGLTDRAEAARAALIRAAAACDITGLQYGLDVDATLVLGDAATNRFEPRTWLATSPDLMGEVDTALRQPARLVDDSYVFPAWFAADSFDDLTPTEQAAMTTIYGDEAPAFWTDFFSIATGGELSVTIARDGLVTAIERPLS